MIEAGFFREGSHEDQRPQDTVRVRPLSYCQRARLKEMASRLDTFIKAKDAAMVAKDGAPKQKRAVN
jgi:hypothetical protein